MPAVSKAQQRMFGMIAAGKKPMPKGMTREQVDHFASTPTKGLPEHSAGHEAARRVIAKLRRKKR